MHCQMNNLPFVSLCHSFVNELDTEQENLYMPSNFDVELEPKIASSLLFIIIIIHQSLVRIIEE